jgi:hypothetical protein
MWKYVERSEDKAMRVCTTGASDHVGGMVAEHMVTAGSYATGQGARR